MKEATVIVAFQDLQEGILRNPGDTFRAADARAKQLEELGFVQLADPKPAARKKNTSKK